MSFHNILGKNLIDFYVASWQFNWKDGHILLSNGDVVATWFVPPGAVLVSNPQFPTVSTRSTVQNLYNLRGNM